EHPVSSIAEVKQFGQTYGYPIMIKALLGGGGRGMRVIRNESGVEEAFKRAKSEAKSAFGNDDVYVEKFIERPKHIEVQIIGDQSSNIVHLYESDCSVQRSDQKFRVAVTNLSLSNQLLKDICEAAVVLMKSDNHRFA